MPPPFSHRHNGYLRTHISSGGCTVTACPLCLLAQLVALIVLGCSAWHAIGRLVGDACGIADLGHSTRHSRLTVRKERKISISWLSYKAVEGTDPPSRKKRILDSVREVVALHKEQYVFPIQLAVTKVRKVSSFGLAREFGVLVRPLSLCCTMARLATEALSEYSPLAHCASCSSFELPMTRGWKAGGNDCSSPTCSSLDSLLQFARRLGNDPLQPFSCLRVKPLEVPQLPCKCWCTLAASPPEAATQHVLVCLPAYT
eukprot:1012150-Pelagomonas_calceolata.AAC.12